jgi:hypothetical protein
MTIEFIREQFLQPACNPHMNPYAWSSVYWREGASPLQVRSYYTQHLFHDAGNTNALHPENGTFGLSVRDYPASLADRKSVV